MAASRPARGRGGRRRLTAGQSRASLDDGGSWMRWKRWTAAERRGRPLRAATNVVGVEGVAASGWAQQRDAAAAAADAPDWAA